MPLFEFECNQCNEVFEELIAAKDVEKVQCPKCASVDIKKLLSSGSIRMGHEKNVAVPEKCGGCCISQQCGMNGH